MLLRKALSKLHAFVQATARIPEHERVHTFHRLLLDMTMLYWTIDVQTSNGNASAR